MNSSYHRVGSPQTCAATDEGAGQDLVFHAALLAGLGAKARTETRTLFAQVGSGRVAGARTCIETGNALLVSVRAPGPRAFEVHLLEPADDEWRLRWRSRRLGSWPPAPDLNEFLVGPHDKGWRYASAFADGEGAAGRLRHYHALLGPWGYIFGLSRSTARAGGPSWVMWKLDRHTRPARVLEELGLAAAWPSARALLGQLLGRPVTHRTRPWSLSVELDSGRVRLGTTAWALAAEDDAKHRRMADAFEALAGDGRFAQALYRLLRADDPGNARIGRAVELELDEHGVKAMELHLCPSPSALATQRTEMGDVRFMAC